MPQEHEQNEQANDDGASEVLKEQVVPETPEQKLSQEE